MKTWRLRSSLWVPHPPAAVFPFFANAHNLERLSPDWLSFEILTPAPIDMHAGTLIDYRIRLRGLPMRWQTRIAVWQPPHCFVDEQQRGPYALWRHSHTFASQDGGTRLDDDVVMRPKGGPLAPLAMALLVRGDVERIFRFRAEVMASQFGGARAGAGRVWWDDRAIAAGTP